MTNAHAARATRLGPSPSRRLNMAAPQPASLAAHQAARRQRPAGGGSARRRQQRPQAAAPATAASRPRGLAARRQCPAAPHAHAPASCSVLGAGEGVVYRTKSQLRHNARAPVGSLLRAMVVKGRARKPHRPLCLCCAEAGAMPFSLRRAAGDGASVDDTWAPDRDDDDDEADARDAPVRKEAFRCDDTTAEAHTDKRCAASPRPGRLAQQRPPPAASATERGGSAAEPQQPPGAVPKQQQDVAGETRQPHARQLFIASLQTTPPWVYRAACVSAAAVAAALLLRRRIRGGA